MYLKESVRIIHHFVSGNPVEASQGLCLGISGGIPKIVPGSIRHLIRARDAQAIRCTLSVLSVFRIMKVRSILKLDTITGPFTGVTETMPVYELKKVVTLLTTSFGHLKVERSKFIPLNSAGPNFNPSILGLSLDALGFKNEPSVLEAFKIYASRTDNV